MPRFLQRVINQCFVRPTGCRFCETAQYAVESQDPKEQIQVGGGGKSPDQHFYDHEGAGDNHHLLTANQIGKGTGWYFGEQDGGCPDGVENGELLERHSEIQIDDGKDGVIKTGVKKHPEGNEVPDVGMGDCDLFAHEEETGNDFFKTIGVRKRMMLPRSRQSQGERP